MKQVLIIQAVIKQYRVPFYDVLARILADQDVSLKVLYSDPNEVEARKGDNSELGPAIGTKVSGYWFASGRLLWQPVFRDVWKSDLIIVECANKHLINPVLLLLSKMRVTKTAFWGHGRNRQGDSGAFTERLKRLMVKFPEWWFAYTEGTGEYVAAAGFPRDRITNVQNSIDTSAFRDALSSVTGGQITDVRRSWGISQNAFVGLFCGSLYPHKKLEFLIEAAQIVKSQLPDFHLLIVGTGPQRDVLDAASRQHDWIHPLGARFDHEKATLFKCADVFLMPGLVGLSILDSFTAGLPLLTTDIPIHSPEIEYLKQNFNGAITPFEPKAYAQAIVQLANDPPRLARLRDGARRSASLYGIEAMAASFAEGVLRCLNTGGITPEEPGLVSTDSLARSRAHSSGS